MTKPKPESKKEKFIRLLNDARFNLINVHNHSEQFLINIMSLPHGEFTENESELFVNGKKALEEIEETMIKLYKKAEKTRDSF